MPSPSWHLRQSGSVLTRGGPVHSAQHSLSVRRGAPWSSSTIQQQTEAAGPPPTMFDISVKKVAVGWGWGVLVFTSVLRPQWIFCGSNPPGPVEPGPADPGSTGGLSVMWSQLETGGPVEPGGPVCSETFRVSRTLSL